ncbi:DDE-type integrase/transposase/recombinase [Streptomyces sp. NPDC048254]|uniref:DDE-type integrase/transposase/recombinase n=1 Tax=Streptomyces sp. NPDC048254 TaxID=3365525 RepID=UPI00372163DC
MIETGRPIPEVAEELGVHSGTLHSWVSRWRRNGSASSDRPTEPAPPGGRMREAERAEPERLRREMSEKDKRIRELEIDLFSRRLPGCARGTRHDAELVVASLNMAAATRGGDVKGVIFHSDRGSEYGSRRFRRACRRLGGTQSMGRVGSCFDNALSEAPQGHPVVAVQGTCGPET